MEIGLSPAFGWILFVPFQLAVGTGVRWVTATLLCLLLVPLGYWGAWCRPRRYAVVLLTAGVLLVLAVIPAAGGFPPVHWSEWLAALAGASVGWALQRVPPSMDPVPGRLIGSRRARALASSLCRGRLYDTRPVHS